jgi:hypothetical protein
MKRVQFVCVKTVTEMVEMLIPDEHDPSEWNSSAINQASFDEDDQPDYDVAYFEVVEEGVEDDA